MDQAKTIVIVGGGFAGTTLARALDGKLPPGYELVLISEESYTTFNPMLPEAVGASIFPEQVVAPIRQMLGADPLRHGPRDRRSIRAQDVLTASTLAGETDAALRASRAGLRQSCAARPDPGARRACAAAEDHRRRDAHPQHGAAPRRADRARDRSGASAAGSATSSSSAAAFPASRRPASSSTASRAFVATIRASPATSSR